jgi:hypothetical protein
LCTKGPAGFVDHIQTQWQSSVVEATSVDVRVPLKHITGATYVNSDKRSSVKNKIDPDEIELIFSGKDSSILKVLSSILSYQLQRSTESTPDEIELIFSGKDSSIPEVLHRSFQVNFSEEQSCFRVLNTSGKQSRLQR